MPSFSQHLRISRSLLLVVLVALYSLQQVVQIGQARYVPNQYNQQQHQDGLMRRQDMDEDVDDDSLDDMSSDASVPSRNQDETGSMNDEDNEPDGAYEETPREAEGQADLERFFDDHLGASDRDGMDKENLPSLLRPVVAPESDVDGHSSLATRKPQRIIITRQIIKNPDFKGGYDVSVGASMPSNSARQELSSESRPRQSSVQVKRDDDENRIYVTSSTDKPFKIDALGGFDPEKDFDDASRDIDGLQEAVQVRQPRQAAATASREDQRDEDEDGDEDGDDQDQRDSNQVKNERVSPPNKAPLVIVKDINFNDPDTDSFYKDASETDEVLFDQPSQRDTQQGDDDESRDKSSDADDPPTTVSPSTELQIRPPRRQSDVDSEKEKEEEDDIDGAGGRGNSDNGVVANADYPDTSASSDDNKQIASDATGASSAPSSPSSNRADDYEDESAGNWVNDGVDEMEVPSDAHQEAVLDRAAKASIGQQQEAPITILSSGESQQAVDPTPTSSSDPNSDSNSAYDPMSSPRQPSEAID